MKICLLSIIASHYRSRVYSEMDRVFNTDFIFGIENTSVKKMDTSILRNVRSLSNKYISGSKWYYQPGLPKLIKGYDIIINDLGIYCLSSWLFIFLSKFRKQRVYNWDHGYYGRESHIKTLIKRLYFGLVDGSFIYGDYAIELMKKKGFNGDKLFAIHNSLDYHNQLVLRNQIKPSLIYRNHFKNDNPVLVMIGRLNSRKNLNQLIEAVSILKQRGLFYNVVLIGDGEERMTLEQLVTLCGLNQQVWFYGACYSEEENAELLYNSDMCVVPGDIGLTSIHAMMFGVPVITHDYFPSQGPEFEAIKEGVTGSFFKHNDVISLANTLSTWFKNNRCDREVVRKACYKEVDENWTPQYQINVLTKVLFNMNND